MTDKMIFKPSFAAGEITPAMYGRIDLEQYDQGAETILNAVVHPHGSISNRAGTAFVGHAADPSSVSILVPFTFSSTQAYMLEFSDLKMRVLKDGAFVADTVNITAATQANPVQLTVTGHPFVNGDRVFVTSVVGMTEINDKYFTVAVVDANNITIGVDGTAYTAYSSGGTAASPYKITTTWESDQLRYLDFAQSADVLYVAYTGTAPRKITRTAHDAWTIEDVEFIDGPWGVQVAGDELISITPAARSGNNVALVASDDVFTSDMVGELFRLGYEDPLAKNHSVWGVGRIDQVTDEKNARCDIINEFGANYILNGDFDEDGLHWVHEETTQHGCSSGFTGGYFFLTVPAVTEGTARLKQKIFMDTAADLILTINAKTDSASGPAGSILIKIGSSPGAYDLYNGSANLTTTAQDFTFQVPSVASLGFDSDGAPTSYAGLAYLSLTITITGGSSTKTCQIFDISLVRDNLVTNVWRRPAWTSANGYPSEVAFHEQRLVFCGSPSEPQTWWLSQSGDFEDMSFHTPLQNSDAFSMTMAGKQVNIVKWVHSLGVLMCGTGSNIWEVASGSNAAITPLDKSAKVVSAVGSSNVKPLVIGDVLVVCERGGQHVRAIQPTESTSSRKSYRDADLTVRGSHLLEGRKIVDWAYARSPDSIIWAVADDGVLLGLTFLPEYSVLAWHKHVFTGSVESVGVVQGEETDDVYFVVSRTINGSSVKHIEKLMPRITDETLHDHYFVESGISYNSAQSPGAANDTLSGLDHLEGETVSVNAEGTLVMGNVVSGGEITLDFETTWAHVGLPYTSDVKTLKVKMSDQLGTAQGRHKAVRAVNFRLYKTHSLWAGPDEDNLDELLLRETPMAGPRPLYTGDFEHEVETEYDKDGSVLMRNVRPGPFTLLAITLDVELSDE